MLYERWCRVFSERCHRVALRDVSSGRQWTFDELDKAVAKFPTGRDRLVFPHGHNADFVISILSAWRAGQIACPLETGQVQPQIPHPPNGCVHLKCTSGVTGQSRVVAFTAAQLIADAENIVATMGLRPEWPNIGAISMAHSYGFSNLVLPLLLHGIPLILAAGPMPEMVRRAAEFGGELTIASVPALWRAWHDAGMIPRHARLAISAGAPLPGILEQAIFQSNGLKIHNFYGSTECGGIAYDASSVPRADESCVGTPMRGVKLSVDEGGCLIVESKAVGETYWPDAFSTLESGRFQSNDLVEITDGAVYLRGRISDQINMAGRKLSPAIVEGELKKHPAIADCLVFGVPSSSADRSEIVVVSIVAATPVTSDILRDHLLARIPAWQVPREWWFVESLEVDRRGKISRTEWRKRFLERGKDKSEITT